MKILIVFYSRRGTTKRLAENLASRLGADLEELEDKENRQGFWALLKASRDALRKKKTIISPVKYSPTDYDLVVIGSPTWAGAPACALNTYLHEQRDNIKRAAFFVTQGSSGGDKVISRLIEASGVPAVATLLLNSPEALSETATSKIEAFIKALQK